MERTRTGSFLNAVLPALLFLALGIGDASARPRDLELRGTILCRAGGDPRRERPTDPRGLVIEPVGYPGSAEMLGEAGLFRIRVPYDLVDHEIILKIYSGSEQIDVLTVYVEPGKVKRITDKYVYAISSHVLPGKCEDVAGNPEVALQFRDQLRQQGPPPVQAAGFHFPMPALSGVVAALLGTGVYAAQAGAAAAGDVTGQNFKEKEFPLSPGFASLYAQFSSAPTLGRTTTSVRNTDEAALWNPSLLVHTTGNRLGGSGGVRNEWRAAGSWRIPYRSESVPVYLPRIVSAGFLGLFWSKDAELGIPGARQDLLEHRHEERTTFVGFGFAAGEDVSFSLNLHNYHEKFGVVETVKDANPGSRESVYDTRLARDRNDVDLGMTWDATDELRFAVTAYNLAGTEGLDPDNKDVPLSRGVVGASWLRDRFHAGAEFGMNAGELNAAGGVNYRVTPLFAVDLAGSSRWETIQTGIDFTPGPVTGTFRIRWDDREDAAVHLGVGVGW